MGTPEVKAPYTFTHKEMSSKKEQRRAVLKAGLAQFGHAAFRSKAQKAAVRCVLARRDSAEPLFGSNALHCTQLRPGSSFPLSAPRFS